jgi:hypothetical protein
MGAFHSSELEFVFGHPIKNPDKYHKEEVDLGPML